MVVAHRQPIGWRPLLGRIGPGVAVVEVEHQQQSCILDAFAQCFHIVDVLAYALVVVIGRIDKQSNADGIPTLFFYIGQQVVNLCACIGIVCCFLLLILSEHRHVAAHEVHIGNVGGDAVDVSGAKGIIDGGTVVRKLNL